MFVADRFTAVARVPGEVPQRALHAVKPQLLDRLGKPVSEMFPEFTRDFPATVQSMERHWSLPALALMDRRSWLVLLFAEQPRLNLFFHDPFPVYASEPYFDVSMLPVKWATLYRTMESFTITEGSVYSPVGWRNTLLPRWMDVDEFARESGCKRDAPIALVRGVARTGGVLRCWLLTDDGQSLWTDDSGTVYHVDGHDFRDGCALQDPGCALDSYLSHVVAGGRPANFDFRSA